MGPRRPKVGNVLMTGSLRHDVPCSGRGPPSSSTPLDSPGRSRVSQSEGWTFHPYYYGRGGTTEGVSRLARAGGRVRVVAAVRDPVGTPYSRRKGDFPRVTWPVCLSSKSPGTGLSRRPLSSLRSLLFLSNPFTGLLVCRRHS